MLNLGAERTACPGRVGVLKRVELDWVVKFLDGGSGSEVSVSLSFWQGVWVLGSPASRRMASRFSLAWSVVI